MAATPSAAAAGAAPAAGDGLPAIAPALVVAAPPWSVHDSMLPADAIAALEQYVGTLQYVPSPTHNTATGATHVRTAQRLSEQCTVHVDAMPSAFVDAWQRAGYTPLRTWKCVRYAPGGFFARHIDASAGAPDGALKAVVYLNTCARGGETLLFGARDTEGRDTFRCVEACAGRVLLFDARTTPHAAAVAHEAKRIITGYVVPAP